MTAAPSVLGVSSRTQAATLKLESVRSTGPLVFSHWDEPLREMAPVPAAPSLVHAGVPAAVMVRPVPDPSAAVVPEPAPALDDTGEPERTVPTGSVEFTDGTRNLGRVALVGGAQQAQATLEVGDLGLGQHTITAVYGGDTTHVTSRATMPFEVKKPIPVLRVTPSANPSEPGAPVTYHISVVTGLPAAPFRPLFGLPDADLKLAISFSQQ